MSNEFHDCKVMISAGGSGIGLELARTFLRRGAQVHVCDISKQALASAKAELPELGVYRADVSDEDHVEAWFEHALGDLGGLDVMVNNAGISGPTASVTDITVEDWDRTMAVNLRGHFLCLRRAVPALRSSDRATVINMSSVAGRLGYPLRTAYAASKWAVVGLTQSLAVELGEDNITVNAVLPGVVESDRTRQVMAQKAMARQISEEEMRKEILANVALHRTVPMKDVAAMVLLLASRAGRSLTGQSLNVCAGVQSLR